MTTQTTEGHIRSRQRPNSFLNHKTTAIGLWVAAAGIFIQVATGATGYPKVPPGIIILVVVGILIYATAKFRWASFIGLILAGKIAMGVFTFPGTGLRLSHPEIFGPFLGTLVQLAGLIIALVAGMAGSIYSYRPERSLT
jgi:hypothetical protein